MTSKNLESSLKGSQVLSGKLIEKGYNRISHYLEFCGQNRALSSCGADYEIACKTLRDKFTTYRDNWSNLPKECVSLMARDKEAQVATPPLCLDLEVAAICDLACPYCYRQTYTTPDKIMKIDLAKYLIKEAAELGIPSIKFNWRGEPLLNPNLTDLIGYAKELGIIDTIINTNATQLNREKAKKLIQSGVDYVIFSFDGGTSATYEKNRIGRFGNNLFTDVVSNIKGFCQLKEEMGYAFPWTKIQMVLTPESYGEQSEFRDLFSGCVDEVVVNQYSERGLDLDLLSESEVKIYMEKIAKASLPPNTAFMKLPSGEIQVAKSRLPCHQPFQRLLVTYDGRVSMCCYDWGSMHTVGYVAESALKAPEYDKIRIQKLIDEQADGFREMNRAVMPPQYHRPEPQVSKLSEIWNSKAITDVRRYHAGDRKDVEICEKCTFKDTYDWI
jgi:MoaA/NifB/PqqE/SkfB family radical SAM enzyme